MCRPLWDPLEGSLRAMRGEGVRQGWEFMGTIIHLSTGIFPVDPWSPHGTGAGGGRTPEGDLGWPGTLHDALAMWPCAGPLTFLSLGFLICRGSVCPVKCLWGTGEI